MKQAPAPPREVLTKELYARFSRTGLWRQRLAGTLHTFTWLALLGGLGGLKRALDFCVALAMIVTALPLIVWVAVFRLDDRKPFFTKTRRAGRWCEPFDEYSFAQPPRFLVRLPLLFTLLLQDTSFF